MLIIYENEYLPEELNSFILNNKNLKQYFTRSFDGIKSNGYCGFLVVNEQEYFIAPKISGKESQNLDIFLHMLMYAYDIKISNVDIATQSSIKHKIFEIFIRYFADTLFEEVKKGVFKKYITLQENLKVLRGKYLIDENLKYNFKHQNVYCEFDEFSMDNELNRFFLFALKTFMKFSSYDKLRKCEAILDEVEFLRVDFERLRVHFDRMSNRYQKSYQLAMMILHRLIPLTSKNTQSFAFLFDMSEVFEKFIGNIYKSINPTTKLQGEKVFGNLSLKPDIVTDDMIIDTKYKIVKNREDLATADKYQMFTYGTNFGIKETMLLYPKHIYDVMEDLELGTDEKIIGLKMRSVDLSFDGGYEEYVEELKNRVGGI